MTTTSLRTVTLKTVANYRHAAERTLRAYRTGGQRLIAVVRQGVDRAALRGAEPYVPAFAAAIRRAGDNLGTLANQGLDAVSERTSRAIEAGADTMTSQVKRVADLAGGVDNKVLATGLQAAVRISLPGAQVALALSERVASGAEKLADVAGGAKSTKATKAAGKRRGAKADATDVVAEVKTEVKAAARRARTSTAKVVAAAEKAVAKPVKATRTQAGKAATAAKKAIAEAQAAKPVKTVRRKAAAVVQAAQDAAEAVAA